MAFSRNGRYQTPPATELSKLMWVKPGVSTHIDEVRPGIYIGDMYAARDKKLLQSLNITHVLNATHNLSGAKSGAAYYEDVNIKYHGIEAHDTPSFDMRPFFKSAAEFIHSAVSTPRGKVLVHCAMGLSRSSTLVLAYLLMNEKMTLVDAIKAVAPHRHISPNSGFLEQLRELDTKLQS